MKPLIYTLLCIMSISAPLHAQMQNNAQALGMMECMQTINQQKMAELMTKAEKIEGTIRRLCSEGKDNDALALAKKEGRILFNDANFTNFRNCIKKHDALTGLTQKIDEIDNNIGKESPQTVCQQL